MKLEINYREENGKSTNTWIPNNVPLKFQCENDEIKVEISLKTNENENTTFQNLPDAAKAVLRGKFIVIQACLTKKKQQKQPSDKQPNLPPTRIRKRRTN